MHSCKKFSGFLLLAILFWLPNNGLSQTTNNKFTKFEWAGAEFNKIFYPKAAILVPIKVTGSTKKLFAQLDTGSNGTFFYGKMLEKHGVKFDSDKPSSINFFWMGLSGTPDWLKDSAFVSWSSFEDASVDTSSEKPEDRIVGTIGLDKIVGKILILDFPQNEYAIFQDSSELPAYLKDKLGYVPAVIDNARFYVSIVIGKDTLKNIFYDTGASMSTLTLPLEDWRKATGLRGNESEVIRDSVYSWGEKVEVLKASAKGDLQFGNIRIKSPRVEHVEWPDTSFNSYRLMGNAPFYDEYTVVVDCKYSRMGVAKEARSK
ncbi:MAG TPA: hypothetical protein VMT04_10880 [Terriglobales bacterium]|nr:hypothetical protein [Terriglobales bacterium]